MKALHPRLLSIVPLFALVSGMAACSRDSSTADRRLAQSDAGEMKLDLISAEIAPSPNARAKSMLAYEHQVSIELDMALIQPRMEQIQASCRQDEQSGCTILDVSMNNRGAVTSGSIRMRLAPAAVGPLLSIAGKDGRITDRNTHAEDLAQPVADSERELAQLTAHRDRLTGFMADKSLKIDQIITVSRELATVQARLDEVATQRANLKRRIDTEVLTLNLSPPMHVYEGEQRPVIDALKSFGNTFTQAVGHIIRFVAVLLPWLVIIVPGLILLRLLWRRIGRWLDRREQRKVAGASLPL